MNRQANLAKNTAILAIGTFLPKLASFITLPILTCYLTKEEYGTYDLITVLVSLILPTATLQVQTAAFRFLIDIRDNEEKVKQTISTIMVFIVPVSIAALGILFFCLPSEQVSLKLWICAYFMADILVNALRQVARGLERNLDYSISAIVSALGKMVFAIIFVWYLKIGLLGSVIALFGASFISLIVLVWRSKLHRYFSFKYFSFPYLKELLVYSWPMIPNNMSMWVVRVSDRIVITMVMGPAANAVYSVANKIPSLLTLAQSTFAMAWQENASIVSKDKDADAYYSLMFRTMFDLIAGFFCVLIAANPLLFRLLIKGDYAESYVHIPILFFSMFFFSMSTFLGGIYIAFKASKNVGITSLVAAIINLLIDIATIHWIGIFAASISTLLSYVFLFIFRLKDVQRLIKLNYQLKHVLLVIVPMILECILCIQRNWILNIVNVVVGCVLFVILNKTFIKTVYRKTAKYVHKSKQ